MNRRLCVVVHDVAPATWPACERLLAMLDALGASPLTLLVVPDFHGRGRIDTAPEFVRALDRRRARGDEIALHGYFHRDDAPGPRSPRAWLRRRVLTAGEGEFADMDTTLAEERLRRGSELFAGIGWQAEGFVAPAWLANSATLGALRRVGMHWTSTHTTLIDLARERHILAPCLTASSRSHWRLRASLWWLRVGVRLVAPQRLVRVGLHPADADHPELIACWQQVILYLLACRTPLTKAQALEADESCAAMPCAAAARESKHEIRLVSDSQSEAGPICGSSSQ